MISSKQSLVYLLPCKPGSVYINLTNQCLNDCLFCIKRDGFIFYSYDLWIQGQNPTAEEILYFLNQATNWNLAKEIVFCGMGEPLLRYDCVMDICQTIRQENKKVCLRIDTSGLFWGETKRIDILDYIDVLSVSLNAENAEKYEELCRPQIKGAYDILIDFLNVLKSSEKKYKKQGVSFPKILLSVVDTSEEEFIPVSGRQQYSSGAFPVPDFRECRRIADTFGWPLIIKRLFRDSRNDLWNNRFFQDLCIRGVSPEVCENCTHRH